MLENQIRYHLKHLNNLHKFLDYYINLLLHIKIVNIKNIYILNKAPIFIII